MVSVDNWASSLLEQTERCSPSVLEDLLSTCIPSRAILWCRVRGAEWLSKTLSWREPGRRA